MHWHRKTSRSLQNYSNKKFDDGGGISHFGAICLTRIPGDPDQLKDIKLEDYIGLSYKSGKSFRDVNIDEEDTGVYTWLWKHLF